MRWPVANGRGKTLLLTVSLAFNLGAFLAVAVQAYGGPEPTRWRDHCRRHREALTEELGLTPEQEEVLAASRETFFAEVDPLMRQVREEARVLAQLITAAKLDTEAVAAQADKVAAARNDIHQRLVRHLLSFRDVLEPEQLELFKGLAGKILSRPEERKRPHGGTPPCRNGDDAGP